MYRRLGTIAFFLALLACRKDVDPEADGRKVTAESTYDATETIVHEGFRFELRQPGPDWKLLRAADVRKIAPEASVGALVGDGRFGAVLVERRVGGDLDGVESLLENSYPDMKGVEREDIRFGGFPARRTTFVHEADDMSVRYVRVILFREGFTYQLLAWGNASKTSPSELQPFFDAFSFTEGEIVGEEEPFVSVSQARGTTWRVDEGVFESAVSGVRVRPPKDWRLILGEELAAIEPDAEVMLSNERVGAHVSVRAERYGGGDPSKMLEAAAAAYVDSHGPAEAAGEVEIAGVSVPLRLHVTDLGIALREGVLVRDDVLIHVAAWSSDGVRESAFAATNTVLSSLEIMRDDEREALVETMMMDRSVDDDWLVVSDANYLGRRFNDFAHSITWTAPLGLFDVRLGDLALQWGPEVVLVVSAPLRSSFLTIEVFEGDAATTDEAHESLVEDYEQRRDQQRVVDGTAATLTTGIVTDEAGLPFDIGTLSAKHHGHRVLINAWASHGGESALPFLRKMIDGVGLPPVLADQVPHRGRYLDRRFGFSVAEPPKMKRSNLPPAELARPMRGVRWAAPGQYVLVVAVPLGRRVEDEEWLSSLLEQQIRDNIAKVGRAGKPEAVAFELDGVPARRLRYPSAKLEVVAVARGTVLYLLTLEGLPEAPANAFVESFRWDTTVP